MAMGNLIRRALDREGRTQTWLAGQLGVTQSQVSKWIRSDNLKTRTLRRIHNVLSIPELLPLLSETATSEDEAAREILVDGVPVPIWAIERIRASSRDPELWRELLELARQAGSLPPEAREDLRVLLASARRLSAGRVRGGR